MRVFLSAGEPSGDMHAANLIHRLRHRYPGIEVLGFGGEKMAQAGCRLVFPLCDFAVMGLGAAIQAIPTFKRILDLARETFAREKPDALVMIDYPGFHWWLARAARKERVPVSYFVPPQIWAWASWRVGKMRRLCDQVLSGLPFEHEWLLRHGVHSQYVGHPYFDELTQQRLDGDFIARQRARPGPIVGLLPGSRWHELRYNTPSLLRAAGIIHARRPDVRFLVACLKNEHGDFMHSQLGGTNLPIEVHQGRTPEIIQLSHSCMSVSGSVSLELLHRGKPAAILYRLFWTTRLLGKLLLRSKYITLVNLLADRLLFPEYVSTGCLAEPIAGHILHWLQDRSAYEDLCGQLSALKAQVAQPGACERAAAAIGELIQSRKHQRAA
jgi:lipid-A-disaccharide synthase